MTWGRYITTFTSFFKNKKTLRSKSVGIKVFRTIFCLIIEGFGSGSAPLTNEFGRHKHIQILGIRIRNNAKRKKKKKSEIEALWKARGFLCLDVIHNERNIYGSVLKLKIVII